MDKTKFWLAFEDAIYNFDFQAVEKVMQVLNWQWCDVTGIPTIEDMQTTVRVIFNMVYKNIGGTYWNKHGLTNAGTGGFEITAYANGRVKIQFIVTTSTGFTREED